MKNLELPALPIPKGRSLNDKYKKPKNGLTKREYACIHPGIPESGDAELDALIRKSERKKIAAMVLQAITQASIATTSIVTHMERFVPDSIRFADQLISELEPEKSE